MKRFALAAILMLIPAVASAQWGEGEQPPVDAPAIEQVEDVTLAAAKDETLKAAASDVASRAERVTLRERRAMGITRWSVLRKVIAMHNAGDLDGKDSSMVTQHVAGELQAEFPQAYAEVGIDKEKWEAIMWWIEQFVKWALFFIAIL